MVKKANHIQGKPALTTTQIGKRLGFYISGIFIESTLNVPADYKSKTTKMWYESNFEKICFALGKHIFDVEKGKK